MARREEYQPGQTGGGLVSFDTYVPRIAATDYSNIRQALDNWTTRSIARDEARAEEAVKTRATEAQRQLGTGGLASPEEQLATRYQDVWKERTRALYLQELELDALKMNTDLSRKHALDPDGYTRAWSQYVQERTKSIEADDYLLADSAKRALETTGTKQWAQISDAAYKHQLAQQKARYEANLKARAGAIEDALLNAPDQDARDQILWESINAMGIDVDIGAEFGMIAPEAYGQAMNDIDVQLRSSWLRGAVMDAAQRGDYAAANGYIARLDRGGYFVDNAKARSMSGELRSMVNQMSAGPNDALKQMRSGARRVQSIYDAGGDPGPDGWNVVKAYTDMAFQYGSPSDVDDAIDLQADLGAAAIVNNVSRMPVTALPTARELIANQYGGSPNVRSKTVAALDERVETVSTTISLGDPNAIRNLYPDVSYSQASQLLNIPADDVPTFSSTTVANAITTGLNTNTFTETMAGLASESVERGLGAADLIYTISAAAANNQLEDNVAGAAILGGALLTSGQDEMAQIVFYSGSLPSAPGAREGLGDLRYDKIMPTLGALVGHDARQIPMLRSAVDSYLVGQIAGGTAVDAQDAFDKLERSLKTIDTQTVGGKPYMAYMFGDTPVEQRANARALDRAIARAVDVQNIADEVSIVPTGAGGFRALIGRGGANTLFFADQQSDTWMPTRVREQNDRVLVETAQAAGEVERELANPAWLEEIAKNDPVLKTETARAQFNQRIETAAKSAKIDIPKFRRLAAAYVLTPEDERETHIGALGHNQELDASFGQIVPMLQMPWTAPTKSILSASEKELRTRLFHDYEVPAKHYAKVLKTFDNDEEKALAAYWSTPELVKQTVDAYGEAWLEYMPGTVQNFVYRGMSLPEDVESLINYIPYETELDFGIAP